MILANRNIRTALIIIVLLLLAYLLRGWFKDKLIVALGGYVNKETETVIEKEYIKGKVDTVAVFNHYVKTRGIILNPKPKVITKWLPRTEDDGDIVETELKEFKVDISDKLIKGEAIVINRFDGTLESLDLNYKPLFPKYITRVDTVKIHTKETITLDNTRAKIGVGLGYNSLNYPSVLAGYTTKDGWQFLGEYGKALNDIKVYQSGQTFFTPADDLISLKIIKNF